VFDVHEEVDDIQLRLEILDKNGTQILQMLSFLQGTGCSLDQAPSAPAASTVDLVTSLQMPTTDNSSVILVSTLLASTFHREIMFHMIKIEVCFGFGGIG
jgi:hypothetical protein